MTNKPTEAEIEAAARALADAGSYRSPSWDSRELCYKNRYRLKAEAALEAAAKVRKND